MKRRTVRIGGLVMVVLVLSAAAASAQDAAGGVAQLGGAPRGRQACSSNTPALSSPSPSDSRPPAVSRFSSVRSGLAPTTRSSSTLTGMRVSAADWSSSSAQSCATRSSRTSASRPYAVVGTGRGVERPNVNEFFPHDVDRKIVVIYYGAGARIPIPRRLDAFADWRLIITGDDAAEMAVLGPLRAGIAFRF
jgi:hypothetical protein